MDSALILADRILTLIRETGASKLEAHSALSVAQTVLPSIDDISFDDGVQDHSEAQQPS